MVDNDRETGTGYGRNQGTETGTAASRQTETVPSIKVVTGPEGVKIWPAAQALPPGYTVLHTRAAMMPALMNFNALELREVIVNLCLSG